MPIRPGQPGATGVEHPLPSRVGLEVRVTIYNPGATRSCIKARIASQGWVLWLVLQNRLWPGMKLLPNTTTTHQTQLPPAAIDTLRTRGIHPFAGPHRIFSIEVATPVHRSLSQTTKSPQWFRSPARYAFSHGPVVQFPRQRSLASWMVMIAYSCIVWIELWGCPHEKEA